VKTGGRDGDNDDIKFQERGIRNEPEEKDNPDGVVLLLAAKRKGA